MATPIGRGRLREKWLEMSGWWTRHGAWALAILFVSLFFGLMVRQHEAFHTRALDLGKFDQAIWNTLHGRFLFSSVQNHSILGNHFSPFMALLSPLFLLWSDVRVLFFVQTVGLAAAGLFLYRIVGLKHPALAPWFLLAFYLNPALHEVALVEFRRVTLAVPFLALALYALAVRKRIWMVAGLFLALLCKENVALAVFMVGIYLLLFERDWQWGMPLVMVGLVWAVGVTLWVVPAFRPPRGEGSALYPQLSYLGLVGDSYQEILTDVLRDPLVLFRHMLDRESLLALWRVFLPLGLSLPFLAPDWLLMVLPPIVLMLMSVAPGMHRLEDWYMASVLPGLFAAIATALARRPVRWARWLTAGLLCATVAGTLMFSTAPWGAKFKPELYTITEHHRLAAQAVAAVPPDARVATQDPYVPHLSHREHIYLYPWVATGVENVDYLLLDRNLHPYPLQPHEMASAIDDAVADTSYVVELEGDGIYLLHRGGEPLPAFESGAVAGETMRLNRVEMAVRGEDGFYRSAAQEPVNLQAGDELRISLYWEALADPGAERTVSVRIADRNGTLAAVHDNMPGRGKKPTSWWRTGWQIRDVYYMTISPQAPSGPGSLDIVVYDSYSGEIVPFGSMDALKMCDVHIGG